ncbi:hypothetical protein BUALT_Bualt01G0036800 [Buddleja alternifolia]|uniref:CST complex subunit CTC1 n=1 Tax=Buddleja alternifolia TaxID=168488 RepID=A0AAV6Y8C0_9LAMI|nr:hypothetical protein BUALT_Bualt01G0036800 [Buddleja alternifolia]
MEDERTIIFTIADLIHRARPLSGASSLTPSRPIATLKPRPNSDQNQCQKPPVTACQGSIAKTLKPLTHPTVLVGTLILPSFADTNSTVKCSCFQFSDDSAVVCCDVLDFNPEMIGRTIRIVAWNFIPFKCGSRGGFLEIINWVVLPSCGGNVCSLSDFSSSCLTSGSCDVKDNSKAKCSLFGVVESISPVSIVPCATAESGSRNVSGFFVNMFVCECKLCSSKLLVSQLNDLSEESIKDHCFVKKVIIYFCGLTSSWHPLISKMIGDVILLMRLKKKLVFIGKEESQLMYVTTDNVSLHVPKLFKKPSLVQNRDTRGKGESCSYTGVVTGVYMQGMVVELDQDVMLLLTDRYLTVPHCLRVGAIVTVRNVHFVDPKFSWGKIMILGACCRTSLYMESFSPLETGCHSKSHSQSLLQKFMDSLSFSARLWVLLVISSFRKKFAGIISDKEILGSKHKEGLAQKYASMHLPLSAFEFRHGILVEFCKHDLCSSDNEVDYGNLKLVLPISNLITYCEALWKKILDDWENCVDFWGGINQKQPISCDGRSYPQSIIKVLRTREIGVVAVGILKMSLSSGRLQLIDATGGVDIMLDLPVNWDFNRIFEAKDSIVIMEGIPQKLVDLNSIADPLSCQSIFNTTSLVRKTNISLYLHQDPSGEDSRSRSLFSDLSGYAHELESGKFHLLMLTHKFPIQLKFQGDQANRVNMFAQAIVMPWNLLISGKHEDAITTWIPLDHLKDSPEKITRFERHHKRCKIDQASIEASDHNSCRNSGTESTSCVSLELPCLIASKGVDRHFLGILRCTNECFKIFSGCKPPRRRLLLEFGPDSFCMYEALKIGRFYLIKHEEDKLCSSKDNYKVFISSGTHFWSFTFSSSEGLESSNNPDISQFHNGIDCENSDVNLLVPSSALKSLENDIKILGHGLIEPTKSFWEESDASTQSSGNALSDYPLPVGNLVSLHGLIVALHDCVGDTFPAKSRLTHYEGCSPICFLGNGDVCVHVLVENRVVRIFCDLSKQAYPIGLGRDVNASFHQILALNGQNKYMMIPVSFITIDHTSLMNGQCNDKFNYTAETICLNRVTSPNTVPAAMICDLMQLSEFTPVQFRCRVGAVYILVVEKSRSTTVFQSNFWSIPIAGFVLDDGSSSCCCWANSDTAAALLGLDSEASAETSGRYKTGIGSTVTHLNQIMEKHSKVVVKNYGSVFDSLSQELAFSVGSDKLICSSDEDLLRSLIINASFSTSRTICGGLMDPSRTRWLKERLTELDLTMPPLQNVWATSVSHTDILAEARNMFKDLSITAPNI